MDRVVQLSRTYEAHGKSFDSVVIREPTGSDYWLLGPIAEWQPVGEGTALVTYHDRVQAYVDRLIKPEAGLDVPSTLAGLSLSDTLKIAQTVKGFFSEANRSNEPPISSAGEPGNQSGT